MSCVLRPFRDRQGQVAEHVIEGAVLEHHDDDVLDLREPRRGGIGGRGDRVGRRVRDVSSGDVDDPSRPLLWEQVRQAAQRGPLTLFDYVTHLGSYRDGLGIRNSTLHDLPHPPNQAVHRPAENPRPASILRISTPATQQQPKLLGAVGLRYPGDVATTLDRDKLHDALDQAVVVIDARGS